LNRQLIYNREGLIICPGAAQKMRTIDSQLFVAGKEKGQRNKKRLTGFTMPPAIRKPRASIEAGIAGG
jgi:hypothetical protein